MEMATKILYLKTANELDDDDEVLTAYLLMAKQLILNILYPVDDTRGDKEVPAMYEMKQIEIASYLLNKRGAEGEIQHIENGTHRNYGSSYVPEAMLRDITPYCGVVR